MERCNTCKWWAAEPNEDDDAPDGQKVRACNHPTASAWTIGERYRPTRSDFYYVPRSGTLYTAPDFGCVHHTSDWSAEWCGCANSSDLNMIGLENVVGWVRCSDCGRIKPGELPKNRSVNPDQ